MELIAVEESRLVELLLASRPQAQLYLPTAIAKIQEIFNFAKIPEAIADARDGGVRFFHGAFMDGAIEELSIYGDGIVLVSKSPTSFLIAAMEFIKDWAAKELKIKYLKTNDVERLFESQIVVRSEKNLMSALSPLDSVRDLLESELHTNSNYQARFSPTGLTFSVDPQKNLIRPSAFKVERKSGIDFDYGVYHSIAPLTTDSHVKVLKKLESLCR